MNSAVLPGGGSDGPRTHGTLCRVSLPTPSESSPSLGAQARDRRLPARFWPWGRERWAWGVLLLVLFALVVGALSFDRSRWPYLVGDEATYAMQASSLAWDFDLRYSRQDYDRFLDQWSRAPDGLILQSRDGGRTLTFGKPSLYAVAIAPLVRLAPVRGAAVANALFLVAAALLSAWVLARHVGPSAPLWTGTFLFAAVPFGYVFWVHADLFLMAATAGAFALAYWEERPRGALPEIYDGAHHAPAARALVRWFAVGALLAIPASFRPFYLALFLPLVVALMTHPGGRRWRGLWSLVAGAVLVLLLSTALQWQSGGNWSGYAGERQDFYPSRGYPDVDFPRSEWNGTLERWGNKSWLHSASFDFKLDARLWTWNSLYFLAGRNVGVVPYFLPIFLAFLAYEGGRGRWAILPAVLLVVAATFLISPFNFYGGAGAIGNRYFLPLYPALWFVAARRKGALWPLGTVFLAAPFLFPLWAQPRAFPVDEKGRYVYVSPLVEAWLPYETTQSHIPGGRDVEHNGLWLRFLNPAVGPRDAGHRLSLTNDGAGELLIGSPEPLQSLWLDFDGPVNHEIRVTGAELGAALLRPDGSDARELVLDPPRARHPMWWSWQPWYLYELRLELRGAPDPVTFSLTSAIPTADSGS